MKQSKILAGIEPTIPVCAVSVHLFFLHSPSVLPSPIYPQPPFLRSWCSLLSVPLDTHLPPSLHAPLPLVFKTCAQ